MQYILYMLIIFSFNVESSEELSFQKKIVWQSLNRVEPFDFGTLLLTSFNGTRLVLNCSNNYFYKNKKSHIKYTNTYGIHVRDFLFKRDEQCHFLKRFLLSVFPGVNENKPIEILFNRETGFVDRVLLPDLDELGPHYNKSPKDELTNI